MEQRTGIILSNSPTQTVGYEVKSKLNKVKHDIPMLSLDKTKDIKNLESFGKENPCLFMLKYDGLTVELIYDKGKLIQASTRGDGYIGEDITHNARTFKNIPLTIPYPRFLRLAGEAIIHESDFQKINDNLPAGEKPYANARNLVSGSVRQLDNKICENRNVYFMLWDVLEGLDDVVFNEDLRSAKFLYASQNLGFSCGDWSHYSDASDKRYISGAINYLKESAIEKGIPIDGIVMKYDSISYSKSKGGTSHHNNDGIAFKFEDEIAETTLQDIEWSLGRTGQITPIAIFDPVELNGTTVSRASLHNISIMRDILGFPYLNQKIQVQKANMIIPEVVSGEKADSSEFLCWFTIPEICYSCGSKLEIKHINNTDTLYCVNDNCSGKLLNSFVHFVSKPAMNIEGLSEATLKRFIDNGFLHSFADIYKLNQHKDEIIKTDGFGIRSYQKLWSAIQSSRYVTLDRFLVALGVPGIGKTAAKNISRYCNGDLAQFIDLINKNFDWSVLIDFGEVASYNIKKWFDSTENILQYTALLDYITIIKDETTVTTESMFSNKIVVVTGTLQHFTRNEITKKLENLGAKVSGSVSKKTDYLIVGENAGSKLQKAKQCDIPILTEDEFLEMIQ